MRKMVSVWKLIATLAVILIVYFVLSGSLARDRRVVEEEKIVAEQNLQKEMVPDIRRRKPIRLRAIHPKNALS